MPSKYCILKIKGSIDEIWENNHRFWTLEKGKILDNHISDNGLFRKFEVKSSSNMHIFAFSFGEKYNFQFGYEPTSQILTIIIQVKFNIFGGRGFIWKIPQKTINKWTKFMGFEQIHLESNPSSTFLAATTLLSHIKEHDQITESHKHCPYCGEEISKPVTICKNCGSKLKE